MDLRTLSLLVDLARTLDTKDLSQRRSPVLGDEVSVELEVSLPVKAGEQGGSSINGRREAKTPT